MEFSVMLNIDITFASEVSSWVSLGVVDIQQKILCTV